MVVNNFYLFLELSMIGLFLTSFFWVFFFFFFVFSIICNRSRTYQFDDFLAMWTEKLRSDEQEATVMTVRITRDVDKYKVRKPCQHPSLF